MDRFHAPERTDPARPREKGRPGVLHHDAVGARAGQSIVGLLVGTSRQSALVPMGMAERRELYRSPKGDAGSSGESRYTGAPLSSISRTRHPAVGWLTLNWARS